MNKRGVKAGNHEVTDKSVKQMQELYETMMTCGLGSLTFSVLAVFAGSPG